MLGLDVSLWNLNIFRVTLCINICTASRKGGPRIEIENWSNDVPVVHNYGHSGYGYQSSW